MPSFKATVLGPQGAKVRRVQVDVKPVIKKLAARPTTTERRAKSTSVGTAPTQAAPTPRTPTPDTPRAPTPGASRAPTPSASPAPPVKPGKPEPHKPRKGGMPMKRKPRT